MAARLVSLTRAEAPRDPRVESRRDFLKQLAAGIGCTAAGLLDPTARAGASGPRVIAARTYTNPVYAGSMPDPGVLRHEGMYYAYGTTGRERKSDGRIFTVLRSPDLVAWEELGGALAAPSDDARYLYWAPEVVAHGGRFYLYYAMGGVEEEYFELRVATSAAPSGPFTGTGMPLLDCEHNRFTIDPHPFRDVDGQWYLFYARNYPDTEGGAHPGTGLAVDRLVDMTRLAGECRTVLRAHDPWTLYEAHRRMDVYGQTFDWHTIEGPWVQRHRGRYYCFYSGSNYQTARYGVDYAVADHVMGPDGRDYIVYHAWNADMTVRQLCIDPLDWTPAGPRCAGPTFTPQPAPGRRG